MRHIRNDKCARLNGKCQMQHVKGGMWNENWDRICETWEIRNEQWEMRHDNWEVEKETWAMTNERAERTEKWENPENLIQSEGARDATAHPRNPSFFNDSCPICKPSFAAPDQRQKGSLKGGQKEQRESKRPPRSNPGSFMTHCFCCIILLVIFFLD